MSLYIPGLNLPLANQELWIAIQSDGSLRYNSCGWHGSQQKAIVVQSHGRLIDAEELKKIVANAKHMDAGIFDGKTMYSDHLCIGADYDDVCAAIDETRTIIPAEEG